MKYSVCDWNVGVLFCKIIYGYVIICVGVWFLKIREKEEKDIFLKYKRIKEEKR